jgi:hypothetical protein
MLRFPSGAHVTENIAIPILQLDQSHFVFEKLRFLLSVMLSVSARSMLSQKKYLSYQRVVSVLVGKKAMMHVRYADY